MATPSQAVWVILPTYDEAENIGPISAAILGRAARGHPARRRRRLAGRDRRPGRRHWPPRTPDPRPAPDVQAGARPRLPRRVRRRPRRRCRRSSSRWMPTSATTRRPCPRSSGRSSPTRPTSSSGRATRPAAGVEDWGLGRRLISRGGSLFARIVLSLVPERPDRRVQGLAGDDARGRPVRWRPRRRLRVPDRDDVPGQPGRRAHPRDPDHLPRPARRPEQDVEADRRRGARGRRPAPGRGAARTAPSGVAPAIASRDLARRPRRHGRAAAPGSRTGRR